MARASKGRVIGPPPPADGEQATLWDTPPARPPLGNTSLPRARRTDRATSHRAAHAAARGLTDKQRGVLGAFRVFGPMHDEALVAFYREHRVHQLGLGAGSVWPDLTDSSLRTRRSELVTLGYLCDTGRVTKTARQRDTTVWGIAPAAPAAATMASCRTCNDDGVIHTREGVVLGPCPICNTPHAE